jgi:hypothetical protein
LNFCYSLLFHSKGAHKLSRPTLESPWLSAEPPAGGMDCIYRLSRRLSESADRESTGTYTIAALTTSKF